MSRGSPARSWSCCASSPSPAKRDRVSNGRKLFPVSPAGPRTCRAGLREQGGPVRTGMLWLEGAAGLAGRAGRESHLSASASWQSKRASGRERARRHGCWHGTHGTGGSGARKPTGESAGGRDQGASLALSTWLPLPTEPTSLSGFLGRQPPCTNTGLLHPRPRAEPPVPAVAVRREGAQGAGRAAQPRGLRSAAASPALPGDRGHPVLPPRREPLRPLHDHGGSPLATRHCSDGAGVQTLQEVSPGTGKPVLGSLQSTV